MFFSNEERQIMGKLYKAINENPGDIYYLTFSNGDIIETKLDTCYETDNGLDETDIDFEEYHACAMRVLTVIVNNSCTIKKGQLVEINYHNYPISIKNSRGERI